MGTVILFYIIDKSLTDICYLAFETKFVVFLRLSSSEKNKNLGESIRKSLVFLSIVYHGNIKLLASVSDKLRKGRIMFYGAKKNVSNFKLKDSSKSVYHNCSRDLFSTFKMQGRD